jgi:hypothetical protein
MVPTPAGSILAVVGPQTIVVNLDDTLNNFTETLQHGEFPYNPADSLSEAAFEHYLRKIRSGDSEPGDLFSTEYSYCRFKIHLQCWQQARTRPDGVEFMQWLRRNQWRIVICVPRDLRRAHDCTRAWLQENDIPFDYLFMASDKIVFCKAWGIRHLVDRAMVNFVHGGRHEVNIYCSIMPEHQSLPAHNARGFQTFEEVKRWIQE